MPRAPGLWPPREVYVASEKQPAAFESPVRQEVQINLIRKNYANAPGAGAEFIMLTRALAE